MKTTGSGVEMGYSNKSGDVGGLPGMVGLDPRPVGSEGVSQTVIEEKSFQGDWAKALRSSVFREQQGGQCGWNRVSKGERKRPLREAAGSQVMMGLQDTACPGFSSETHGEP